jgi:7-carboxy-7-deazaguanine synthase (Cx14CxxC type)
MTYAVKEIFYTLQGEGANAGRAAVFCRFAGCNLWSGREEDRAQAVCRFCDTDFVGTDGTLGGKFTDAETLADTISVQWPPARSGKRFVVLTGGEPLLQLDTQLIDALHGRGFEIAVETNGTIDPPAGLDWVCVSPKSTAPLRLLEGNELKVVVPQPEIDLVALERLRFDHHFVQPMDGPKIVQNTQWAIEWCMRHPTWRLSVQSHKVIGIR